MIRHLNPNELTKNPSFSQIITTQGRGKTIYIGGQNAVNANGEIVGAGDIQAQTEKVLENIRIALNACNATYTNLIKLTIYIVQGEDAYLAFQAARKFLSETAIPPAITVLFVAGLMNPDYLIEIDAVAFLPELNTDVMRR